jgi:hypothetical protein
MLKDNFLLYIFVILGLLILHYFEFYCYLRASGCKVLHHQRSGNVITLWWWKRHPLCQHAGNCVAAVEFRGNSRVYWRIRTCILHWSVARYQYCIRWYILSTLQEPIGDIDQSIKCMCVLSYFTGKWSMYRRCNSAVHIPNKGLWLGVNTNCYNATKLQRAANHIVVFFLRTNTSPQRTRQV